MPLFIRALLIITASSYLYAQDISAIQKRADTALKFEQSHIGKDCQTSQTTLDMNGCMGSVQSKTEANFKTFYNSLLMLLKSDSDATTKLQVSQAIWEKYSAAACDAIDAFYRDGSIRITAVTGCHVQLLRSHMQDLNALYDNTLHN